MKPRGKGRLPDYQLAYLNKETDEKGNVGGAWINDDGSIRIKLNTCVVLAASSTQVLTLFKANARDKAKSRQQQYDNDQPVDTDGVPF